MGKLNEEVKSSQKSHDMKNIIMALMLVTLIASLVVNYLVLSQLSKISGDLHSQGSQPVSGDSDNIGKQEQALLLPVNSDMYKIRDIYQRIINREVVKDDYLIGISIDNQLKEDIKEYNELVPRLKGLFAERAFRVLISLFMLKDEDGEFYKPNVLSYLESPSDIRRYTEIIADLSLYKNCTELLRNDSRLAFIISIEGGGSYGMWPYLWHTEYLREHEDVKEGLNRLFDLVERIITALDKEYANIYYKELERLLP
jgi:hypothetical protein